MLNKAFRSALSLLLAFCLLLGTSANGLIVWANNLESLDKDGDGQINYVSIGDSMTNGYGFDGYEQGNYSQAGAFLDTENGQPGVYGKGSYALQFENYLNGLGYDVTHTKLASSALRAEDLAYLLGILEAPADVWFEQVKNYTGISNYNDLSDFYKNAIVDADVITMGIGNASFGAFMLQYVTSALGVMGSSLSDTNKARFTLENGLAMLESEAEKQVVRNIYNEMLTDMKAGMSEEMLAEYDVDTVCNIVAYTAAGFLLHYKACIEWILENNDDVQIILVGLMNTTYGMEITGEGMAPIAFGDMMDDVFGMLNDYIATVPAVIQARGFAPNAIVKYAEQPQPKFIVQAFDDLYAEGWVNIDCGDAECEACTDGDPETTCGNGRLSADTVRGRTIKSYNESLREMIGTALGFDLPEITLEDVESYVFDDVDESDEQDGSDYQYQVTVQFNKQVAEYLGGTSADQLPLVKRYIEATNDTYLQNAQANFTTVFKADIEKEISIAIYVALEEAIMNSVDTMEIPLDALMAMSGDILGALGDMPAELDPANNPGPYVIKTALGGWFTASDTSRAMCKIYGLFKIGDGMSVHPTPAGHDDIFAAVVKAYESESTVSDQVADAKTLATVLNIYDVICPYLEEEERADLLHYVYALLEDGELTDADQEKVMADLYVFLDKAENLTEAEKTALLGDIYSVLKNDAVLTESKEMALVEEIYAYLDKNTYISDEQTLDIVLFAYERLIDKQLSDEELAEIADFVYTTLLYDFKMDDADRIAIIGNVYDILNGYYKLNENKNLVAFENIVDYLYGKDMLDDHKAFAIVHYTYWKLHDGLTADEFKEVVFYAYLVLFADKAPVLDPAISGTAGVSAPVLFASDPLEDTKSAANMEALLFVYNELKTANPEIVEDNPELGVVENLYKGLTEEDEEGNAVLSDAEVFDIFHTVIVAMADPESIPEDKTLTDVVTEKVTAVAEGMTLEDQLILLEKVTEAVNELEKIEQEKLENGGSSIIPGGVSSLLPSVGGGEGEGSNSGVSFSEINKYLKAANTVIQNLKNHEPSLWTDDAEAQYAAISGQIFSMLLNGEGNIDVMELIPALYGMLFDQEGHTLENKIQIVVVIYDTLVELTYISVSRQDAYDYVIDLGKEIQGILDTNLAPVVKELRTDLYELYVELGTLTNTLNNELYKVVEAQREVLEGLNAERAALVAELENLQRQLDAIRNPGAGTYGVQSTRNSVEDLAAELEAAIAETEAAIAALDGSIAALNAKIEADLQGIEEIEAAIAQIRAEIRETETALDAVVDAIEQLNADLEVVYNASLVLNEALENVYNLTLDKIDGKAVVEAVKAIIETVPAIVENLEAAYEQAQVAAEKAQAAIDLLKNFNIQDNVDAIVGGVEDLAGLTEDQIALIQAAAAEAQAKAEALVKEHQPKIEDALKATYTELKTVVIREITAAQTWVENNETTLMLGAGAIALVLLPYMDEYVEYNQETGEIKIHDDKAIEDLKAFIQPYTSKIDAEILKLQGKAEEARKWLEENYPIAKEKLNNKLDDLREELENLDIEFENPYEDEYLAAKAAIEAEIKKVEAMIDALEAKAQEVENYLNTVLAAIDEVEVALDAVIAAGHVVDGDLVALFDALTKLHDELVDLHDAVVTLHDATVEELFEIFGYCGIVADNFVKVLNTLPAYVNVLKHAVELVTSAEFWGGMHEQLMQLMGEYADRLKDFLSEAEMQELILNLLKQYGPVVAEKLLDVLAYLVEEYGHDVAVAFYNYLYNNPEEVIAFFNEYGDEMLDLTKEYGDEALLVVAFALVVYGEDLATYVIENHEAILANLAYWWNIHDEKVFALLQVYAEALGLCEPVRQEIAALREALANLKAELEALKADLENASEAVKAEIEAKIAMIEAAIAEVEAAIAELEAALKAAYETGLANIEALKAAIENLDEKVLELLDAAKKAAIDEINAAIAEVEAAIAGLDAALANLLGDVYEQLKELLISAANMLLDAVIEAVKEYAPKLADDIYNYLYHNPDEVIAFFNEYGDEIWALVEKYGDEALMAVGAVLYLYGEEIAAYIIENQEQLLMAIANWISVHGENAAELLQVYAEALGLCDLVRGEIAKLEALLAELEAKLGELEAELARLQAELEKATDAMKPVIEAAIADVETLIAEIKAAIDEIKAVLPMLNEKLQDLVDALFGLDEALQNLLEIGFDAGALALQQALNAVADAVEALVGVVSDATAEELRKLIDEAKEFLDKAYFDATHTDYVINYDSYYVGLGDDMSVADGYVELLANELGVDFNNLSVPGLSMTDLLYILDEDFVADEYTLAKFAIIYQETGYTVEQMRAVYTAELAKADLVSVGVGSFGITDLIYSQAQGALATILREQMGDYLNNPVIGNYIREILTGYGLNLEATTYTMDWISYIGEDGVAELNEILADVRADLIAKGIPETFTYDFGAAVNEHIGLNFIQPGELEVTIPVADLITMMAESYMYAYVTHLFNAGEVFNSIHEITPNAELLVIGMFNPMDEVVLNFGETTIALGDYYTYMVDVMNLRYLGYAFVVPQTTFVAVPDTMTTVEENVENYADLAQMLMALALNNANVETDVVPTVGGHEYIKEQILNALNVTYGGLLGDVNEDGVVDIVDAWLVMQYDAWIKDEDDLNLALADVNGDGEVDILDAWLIMQYDAWIIDKFPVEP